MHVKVKILVFVIIFLEVGYSLQNYEKKLIFHNYLVTLQIEILKCDFYFTIL